MQDLVTIADTIDVKSYDDKHVDHSVVDGFGTLAQNCFLDNNSITERTGYSMIANDTGEDKPNLGFLAYETPSGKQLLKINDNATGTAANLFYWIGTGNWVKVTSLTFSAGAKCSLVVAAGKVYITNNVDTVKCWDIGTLTLTNKATIPVTEFMVWFHNYLFGFKGSRFYISARDDPENFPIGSFQDISPDDGDYITGTGTIKDELIISKRYRAYSFQGWTEDSFSIEFISEKLASYGFVSPECALNIGNDLVFLSFTGGIPHLRSIVRTKESDTIYGGIVTDLQEGTMKNLSKPQLNKTASVFDGRKAWFFVPNGSSTYNDLCIVYDTITQGVTRHVGIYGARAVVSSITGESKVYFADSRDSKVYVFDGSYDDDGEPIEFIYRSRRFQPDFKRLFKFKYLFLGYNRDSTGDCEVRTSVDENLFDLQETLDLNPFITAFPYTFPIMFGVTDHGGIRIELPYQPVTNIMLELYKNDTTAPVSVHDIAFMGYPKPIRDLP